MHSNVDSEEYEAVPSEFDSDTPVIPEIDAVDAEGGSLLAELRAARLQMQAERSIELDLPGGYKGRLVVRYKPIPWEDTRRLKERFEKSKNPDRELFAIIDTLAEACDEVLVRTDSGALEPAVECFPDLMHGVTTPVRYDSRFAAILGSPDVTTARQVVKLAIPNYWAMIDHHQQFAEWQTEGDSEVDEELAGE
ncbi:MAG: hypothetical protein JHC87_01845 [Thermoleophilaceae bacterium]|nr:hypothetical protein [Thermoleophilaceae bacterium]